jgi:hypothetical protein
MKMPIIIHRFTEEVLRKLIIITRVEMPLQVRVQLVSRSSKKSPPIPSSVADYLISASTTSTKTNVAPDSKTLQMLDSQQPEILRPHPDTTMAGMRQ